MLVNSDILQTYKSKKITNYDEINIFKKYMEVIMNTHNTLNTHNTHRQTRFTNTSW